MDTEPNIKSSFICQKCGKKINRKDNFTRHLTTCCGNQDNVELHKCDECDQNFTRVDNLKQHKKRRHNISRCVICNKSFHDSRIYKSHLKKCEEKLREINKQKGFKQCSTCDISIAKHMLNLHEPICTGRQEKNYSIQCEKCSKILKVKSLKNHKEICSQIYKCSKCNDVFNTIHCLENHEKTHKTPKINKDTEFQCSGCMKKFQSIRELRKHECDSKHRKASGSRKQNDTEKNRKVRLKRKLQINRFRCRECNSFFNNRKELYNHRMTSHQVGMGGDLQQDDYMKGDVVPPWMGENGEIIDQKLKDTYENHKSIILQPHDDTGNIKKVFNFPVGNTVSLHIIDNQLRYIYKRVNNAFKINLSFGIVLKHVETGEYRYFKAYDVAIQILSYPWRVSRWSNVRQLSRKLEQLDIIENATRIRPDTKWKPFLLTNVRYSVSLLNYVLGLGSVMLPEFIKKSKAIIGLDKDWKTGKKYKDNLCLFRCYAIHQGYSKTKLKTPTKLYFMNWKKKTGQSVDCKNFKGVKLEEISTFERIFKVNINIFRLNEEKIATPVYKSACKFFKNKQPNTMNLNIHQGHLSYITNMKIYSQKYECRSCEKLFKTKFECKRHEKTCKKATYSNFPGGFFKPKKNIFEKLEEFDISTEKDKQFYPYFITFDMESLLEKINDTESPNTKFTLKSKHKPISVSIASNVPQYKSAICIVDEDLDILVPEMIYYMSEIQAHASELMRKKFEMEIRKLEKLKEFWRDKSYLKKKQSEVVEENMDDNTGGNYEAAESREYEPPSKEFLHAISKENTFLNFLKTLEDDGWGVEYNDWEESFERSSSDGNHSTITSDNEDEIENEQVGCQSEKFSSIEFLMYRQIVELSKYFEIYCEQIPILGFNSAKYDINLIRGKLIKYLKLAQDKKAYTIKKNNTYLSINNDKFKFLDITQYLPAGTSYSQFLRSFKIKQAKGFLPYEYLDKFEKLHEGELPPMDVFYSTLKQCNILEADYLEYQKLLRTGKTSKEVLECLNLETPPLTKEENYKYCQKVWKENNMKTMVDWLSFYNKLDVVPFIEAVEALQVFYREKSVDIFKESLSVPGVARKMIFNEGRKNNASFALIDSNNKDLFYKIKSNIIGGPSIIFKRHAKAGETFIRNNPEEICQKIIGFDANALYLWAIGQDMPVGPFIRRFSSTGFKPEKRDRIVNMYDWMDYITKTENVEILHYLNNGEEKRIGPFRVDGFNLDSNTVYEFYGCYFHGHICKNTKNIRNEKWHYNKDSLFRNTQNRREYITTLGYKIKEIWECEFDSMCSENKPLKEFIRSRCPTFISKHPRCVDEKTIINAVRNEDLFGMVEVDIEVPSEWPEDIKENFDVSPYDYFKEMSPLFCNVNINFDKIGSHMQEHVKEFNLSQQPRRLLVGGMKGENMLIATPLLKWYIEHGLKITKIREVIEFSKQKCFKGFVDEVTNSRRLGDLDKDLHVLASTMKLIGNSGYGSLIMDKEKHTNIRYFDNEHEAQLKINCEKFRNLEELEEGELYEIQSSKGRITLDLPTQLGYFILQYAKLHMLSFHYDFLMKFVDFKKFEHLQMDTDSAYIAISGLSILDIIKPEMREEYIRSLKIFCHLTDISTSESWFPRTCCEKHINHDKRTPGLFKVEFEGAEMIGLCSKTYVASKSNEVKFSSKGINKKTVSNPLEIFKKVLNDKKPVEGVNHGFQLKNNKIFTYEQRRNGFTYFYCKRKVCEDGIHTEPLDIVLNPRP